MRVSFAWEAWKIGYSSNNSPSALLFNDRQLIKGSIVIYELCQAKYISSNRAHSILNESNTASCYSNGKSEGSRLIFLLLRIYRKERNEVDWWVILRLRFSQNKFVFIVSKLFGIYRRVHSSVVAFHSVVLSNELSTIWKVSVPSFLSVSSTFRLPAVLLCILLEFQLLCVCLYLHSLLWDCGSV